MVLDYIDIRDTFITFLNSVNTIGALYDLSANMDKRVDIIEAADYNLSPEMSTNFPAIGVVLDTKNDETLISNRATNASREVSFDIKLTAIYESFADNDTNLGRFVRNIESNLRNNINLSGYETANAKVLYQVPTAVNFRTFIDEASYYNRSADIIVTFNVFVKC